MTDIVERLREFSGPRYPDDICGKQCMADAADEIERLRAALVRISEHHAMAPELYTSEAELSAGLASIARAALAAKELGHG